MGFFCNSLNLYKKQCYIGDKIIVIDDQNQGHIENQQLRNAQSLTIVPYVENNSTQLLPETQSGSICMDPIYPDFYKSYMINTEGISSTELERCFLEAEWLTK